MQRLGKLGIIGGLYPCLETKAPSADSFLSLPENEHANAELNVFIDIRRKPVLIAGRYMKHARGVSQSPWFVDGERRGGTSVQELVAKVK